MFKYWKDAAHRLFMRPIFLMAGALGAILSYMYQIFMGASFDIATTAGMASFLAFAIGFWIGSWLLNWAWRLASHLTRKWSAMLDETRAVLPDKVLQPADDQEPRNGPSLGYTVWSWISLDLIQFVLIVMPVPVLVVVLDLGYGITPSYWRIAALVAVVLTVFCLATLLIGLVREIRITHQMLQEAKEISLRLDALDSNSCRRIALLQRQIQNSESVDHHSPKWAARGEHPSVAFG